MEEEEKVISASTEDELWQEVISDFKTDPDPLEYHAVLEQKERRVILDIYNNHAVGFEAVAYTSFSAYIFGRDNFRFTINTQSFTDELGKFFGMQDITLGFRNFDEKFVIKSNDEKKISNLFSDQQVRSTLVALNDLSFGIVEYEIENADGKAPFLELKIGSAVSDPMHLREVYNAFFKVLLLIE